MGIRESLRQMRSEIGMTQTDLAERLGKSFLTVNRWENGKGFPSRENAKAILSVAHMNGVSQECYNYLSETLLPNTKRSKSGAAYGFPDIENDFLFQLADGSTNSIYVIEAGTYNLLYTNRKAEQRAVQNMRHLGENVSERILSKQSDKRCFHFFGGLSSPCPFCPLDDLKTEEYVDRVLDVPQLGKVFHIHAKLAKSNKRQAYIIYMTDLSDKNSEVNTLYSLTNDIPEGVGIYNVYSNDRIELVFMNDALFKMVGPERKALLVKNGDPDLALIHKDDRPRLWVEIREALAQNRDADISLRMQVFDEQYHWMHLSGKQIKKEDEKTTFYCQFTEIRLPA